MAKLPFSVSQENIIRIAAMCCLIVATEPECCSIGNSFLIDARRILADCVSSIRKAQRLSRGEIEGLAIGYIAALTYDFLGCSSRFSIRSCVGSSLCWRNGWSCALANSRLS
jgi:hypothetical protein